MLKNTKLALFSLTLSTETIFPNFIIMKTVQIIAFIILFAGYVHSQDEVMNYTDLQEFLPTSISGYEAGEPGGQTMNAQGLSFSSADINFTNSNGDYVRITLLDYAGAINMYQAATATWSTGMSYESDEVSLKQVTWSDNIAGWEQIDKKDRKSTIALGVSDRFFLTIEASNQDDTDLVVSVAKKMDLENLASN